MTDLLPEPIKTDPCRGLKAKLAEIEASIQRLNKERENIIDDIEDVYSAWYDDDSEQDSYYGI